MVNNTVTVPLTVIMIVPLSTSGIPLPTGDLTTHWYSTSASGETTVSASPENGLMPKIRQKNVTELGKCPSILILQLSRTLCPLEIVLLMVC